MKRVLGLTAVLVVVAAVRVALLFEPAGPDAIAFPTEPDPTAFAPGAHVSEPRIAAAPRERPDPRSEDSSTLVEHPIELAITELVALLDNRYLERTRWDVAARGLARSLGREARPALQRTLSAPARPSPQIVAAAELLRQLDAKLAAPQLARLRSAAFGGLPDAAPSSAARRVLADRGDWSDRLALVRELEAAPSEETRKSAAWCLRAVRTHDVLPDLAELLATTGDPVAAELAIVAIESIVRSTEPLSNAVRDSLTRAALEALARPDAHAALPERTVGLLGALGGHEAHDALRDMAAAGPFGPAAAAALAADEQGRLELMDIVRSPSQDREQRLEAAVALAQAPAHSEVEQATAVDGLRELVETGAAPEERRRAVLALAECDTEASRAGLRRSLGDEDERVRAATVIAMTRAGGADTFARELQDCAETDESEGVRELARRSLDRSEPAFRVGE